MGELQSADIFKLVGGGLNQRTGGKNQTEPHRRTDDLPNDWRQANFRISYIVFFLFLFFLAQRKNLIYRWTTDASQTFPTLAVSEKNQIQQQQQQQKKFPRLQICIYSRDIYICICICMLWMLGRKTCNKLQ